MQDFIETYGGMLIGILGSGIAAILCCIGSAKGTGMAGEAGAGILREKPDLFSKALILQVIPGTQGLYGFVIWFICIIQMGIMSGTAVGMSVTTGLLYAAACMPIAIGGLFSALYQGRVAVSSIHLLAKQTDSMGKGVMLCVIVEFYAILCFLASFIMLIGVSAAVK
ncbi:MAG: V-type ATP synthase subunit K [Oscillospiraceae bacterium]|nr:V-type ATP synthase subunit K [Oscillospiraceae bacterium]